MGPRLWERGTGQYIMFKCIAPDRRPLVDIDMHIRSLSVMVVALRCPCDHDWRRFSGGLPTLARSRQKCHRLQAAKRASERHVCSFKLSQAVNPHATPFSLDPLMCIQSRFPRPAI